MLEQILTNAVKYTKKGYVSVCRQGEGEIVIMDTGIGILPEDLPRVFEWGYTGYNGRLDKRSTGNRTVPCEISGRSSGTSGQD